MDGSNLKCGSVSLVQTIKNPVRIARAVMDNTRHNYLVGEASLDKLASKCGIERVEQTYFSTEKRRDQLYQARRLDGVFTDHSLEERIDLSR